MITMQIMIMLVIILRIIILEEAVTTCVQCSAETAKMRGPSGRVIARLTPAPTHALTLTKALSFPCPGPPRPPPTSPVS